LFALAIGAFAARGITGIVFDSDLPVSLIFQPIGLDSLGGLQEFGAE
jgi:hypothetical protein